jgi:hypothetical protein
MKYLMLSVILLNVTFFMNVVLLFVVVPKGLTPISHYYVMQVNIIFHLFLIKILFLHSRHFYTITVSFNFFQ